jgi:hypothetical protein
MKKRTLHMKHLFAEMTELAGTVSFGDASKVEVKGKCNVKFLQKNGKLSWKKGSKSS